MLNRRTFLTAVAGTGVAAVGGTMQLRAATPAGTICGRVTGDGKPLAGVLVSDGCRVVATDTQGQYSLPVGDDSGRFVFVTTPRGYWTERFYRPLGQRVRNGER